MSELRTNNIRHKDTTGDPNIQLNNDGTTVFNGNITTDQINNVSYPTDGALGNRNMIINGAMQVAQRGTSVAMATGPEFCTDRFKAISGSGFDWQSTLTQESDGPSGFGKSLKVNVDTASVPTGGQNAVFYYRFEGNDCQRLAYGTNDAKVTTLSFWVKSNKTGEYSIQLVNNSPGTPVYLLTAYSINSANTWEYKTISFIGDNDNAIDDGNGVSVDVRWNLSCGPSDLTSPTTTWISSGAIAATTNQVNLMAEVNNYWQLTGVQLEVGTRATPFEHRSYGDELAKCLRYYQRVTVCSGNDGAGIMRGSSISGASEFGVNAPVSMRARPSITNLTSNNTLSARSVNSGHSSVNVTLSSLAANNDDANVEALFSHIRIRCTPALSDGEPYVVFSDNSQGAVVLAANAEL